MPPAKRKRAPSKASEAAAAAVAVAATEEKDSGTPTANLTELNSMLDNLSKQVKETSSGGLNSTQQAAAFSEIHSAFLSLKAWQRTLFAKIHEANQEYEGLRKSKHGQEQQLAAWKYERDFLEREISKCASYDMRNLESIARREETVQEKDSDAMTDKDTGEKNTAIEAINEYVKCNVQDPANRQQIMSHLREEIKSRSRLEQTIEAQKTRLSDLQAKLESQRSFLNQLPKQMAAVERATMPLQKHIAQYNQTGSGAVTLLPYIGSDRRQRFEQAQALPAPLYTLFYQIQTYLDRASFHRKGESKNSDDQEEKISEREETHQSKTSGISLSVVHPDSDDHPRLVLKLPIPSVSSKTLGSKRVSINFEYVAKLDIVTAWVTNDSLALSSSLLLDELFPGDAPTDTFDGVQGKPYHWCNYLAGVYMMRGSPVGKMTETSTEAKPPAQETSPVLTEAAQPSVSTSSLYSHPSTRVVLRVLQDRVQAQVTIKHIVHTLLSRQVAPNIPGNGDTKTSLQLTCKLKNVVLVTQANEKIGTEDHEKTLAMELHRNSHLCYAQVKIDMVRYPGRPPVWKLGQSRGSSSDEAALYEYEWVDLERRVNCDQLFELVGDVAGMHDWILVLQLQAVSQEWSRWVDEKSDS
jgi:Fms-interacting protein/Thoc5